MNDLLWICHDCGYETRQEGEAIVHAERTHTHWLYMHDHWRGNPPIKEMHASDWEGVYVTPVDAGEARRMTGEWRRSGSDFAAPF